MIEEFVASHSMVAPWMGPANDMREVVESHPIGPLSDYYIHPEFLRVIFPPRTLLILWTPIFNLAVCQDVCIMACSSMCCRNM
jgi:hypothetical protein